MQQQQQEQPQQRRPARTAPHALVLDDCSRFCLDVGNSNEDISDRSLVRGGSTSACASTAGTFVLRKRQGPKDANEAAVDANDATDGDRDQPITQVDVSLPVGGRRTSVHAYFGCGHCTTSIGGGGKKEGGFATTFRESAEGFVPIGVAKQLDYSELIRRHQEGKLKDKSMWASLHVVEQALSSRDHVVFRRKADIWLTFFLQILGHLVVPLGLGLITYEMASRHGTGQYTGLTSAHRLVGVIVSISIGIKNKAAYDRYAEGQKVVHVMCQAARALVMAAYSALPNDDSQKDKDKKDKGDKGKGDDTPPATTTTTTTGAQTLPLGRTHSKPLYDQAELSSPDGGSGGGGEVLGGGGGSGDSLHATGARVRSKSPAPPSRTHPIADTGDTFTLVLPLGDPLSTVSEADTDTSVVEGPGAHVCVGDGGCAMGEGGVCHTSGYVCERENGGCLGDGTEQHPHTHSHTDTGGCVVCVSAGVVKECVGDGSPTSDSSVGSGGGGGLSDGRMDVSGGVSGPCMGVDVGGDGMEMVGGGGTGGGGHNHDAGGCGGEVTKDKVKGEKEKPVLPVLGPEMRRRLLIFLALVRQSVRESRKGFMPQSVLQGIPFSRDTFVYDPVLPRLMDLLTQDDHLRLKRVDPRRRPFLVVGEIHCMIQRFTPMVQKYSDFYKSSIKYTSLMLDSYESMLRIRDNKMTRPYDWVLTISTCLFVYAIPFLYTVNGSGSKGSSSSGGGVSHPWQFPAAALLMLTELMAAFFFGIAHIGYELENPYGFGMADIPLERLFLHVYEDTQAFARDMTGETRSFIPSDLPPNTIPYKAGLCEVTYLKISRFMQRARASRSGPCGFPNVCGVWWARVWGSGGREKWSVVKSDGEEV